MGTKTYTTYGGTDITAVFNGNPIGTLQAISYSVNREKAAIYTMGKANPRAFSRGKRMIAGSLVFILFDRNPLLDHFKKARFLGDADENVIGSTNSSDTLDGVLEKQLVLRPNYVDQIPPFDVILSAANEYGERASMKIIGIELMNENSGFSIDDIVVEQQFTYVATDIIGWRPEDDAEIVKASVGAKL